MMLEDLLEVIDSKVFVGYEEWGEFTSIEHNTPCTIKHFIDLGYGSNKVKRIYTYQGRIHILIDR